MTTKKEFEDEFEKDEEELETEDKAEEVTVEHVEEALQKYAEEYRGQSGVDPNDHPHFAKAKALLEKMKCH